MFIIIFDSSFGLMVKDMIDLIQILYQIPPTGRKSITRFIDKLIFIQIKIKNTKFSKIQIICIKDGIVDQERT